MVSVLLIPVFIPVPLVLVFVLAPVLLILVLILVVLVLLPALVLVSLIPVLIPVLLALVPILFPVLALILGDGQRCERVAAHRRRRVPGLREGGRPGASAPPAADGPRPAHRPSPGRRPATEAPAAPERDGGRTTERRDEQVPIGARGEGRRQRRPGGGKAGPAGHHPRRVDHGRAGVEAEEAGSVGRERPDGTRSTRTETLRKRLQVCSFNRHLHLS